MKVNKVSNLKQSYYTLFDDAVINKHNSIHTNGNINVTNIHKLINSNVNNYFTKNIEHTRNITNTITRHNHNNYEYNAVKMVNAHVKHINICDTEI